MDRRARQAIFDEHADLAERVARQVRQQVGLLNGLALEDYRQAALLAMWRATDRWKPNGAPFGRYAWPPMWSAVMDEIRRTDEVGRWRRADGITGARLSLEGAAPNAGMHGEATLREMLQAPTPTAQASAYLAAAELLAGLDLAHRAVVWLCEVQGLAQRHAGQVLGISEHAAGRLRREAIEYLRIRARYRAANAKRKGNE